MKKKIQCFSLSFFGVKIHDHFSRAPKIKGPGEIYYLGILFLKSLSRSAFERAFSVILNVYKVGGRKTVCIDCGKYPISLD